MDFFEDEVSDLKLGLIEFLFGVFDPIDEFLNGEASDLVDI